jgi:hypothetical protein
MENATDSAGRHRIRHDEGATVPRYAVGDKVLLLGVTLKKGESIKLKRRYTGPFLIIECRPGYNYRFQHTVTGRDLKRAVHANRLRLLRELPNDYRNRQGKITQQVSTGSVKQTAWRISVGEPTDTNTQVLVY